jgi:hypothetical protein
VLHVCVFICGSKYRSLFEVFGITLANLTRHKHVCTYFSVLFDIKGCAMGTEPIFRRPNPCPSENRAGNSQILRKVNSKHP